MDDIVDTDTGKNSTPAPEQNASESGKHERYLHIDDADDLEDFLHSLDEKSNHHTDDEKNDKLTNAEKYDHHRKDDKSNNDADDYKLDEEYDDEKDGSPYNIHEESKQFDDDYYEDAQESQDAPFSLLELMDME